MNIFKRMLAAQASNELEAPNQSAPAPVAGDTSSSAEPVPAALPLRRLKDLIVKIPRPDCSETTQDAKPTQDAGTEETLAPLPQGSELRGASSVVRRRGQRAPSRSALVSPLRFSKEELEAVLPRKSYFSCHDKALKEAGLGTDSEAEKKRKKKLDHAMSRVKALKTVNILLSLMDTGRTTMPTKTETAEGATGEGDKEAKKDGEDTARSKEGEAGEEETAADASTAELKVPTTPGRSSNRPSRARKKPGEMDEPQHVDHKPLTAYLRYVKENPTEYEHYWRHRHPPSALNLDRRMVKMGTVYQRGHHGRPRHRPVLLAAYELWPRSTDPGLWQLTADKKAQAQALAAIASKKERIVSAGKPPADKEDEKGEHEEARTEMEKWRLKMDKWLKTLTSGQLIQARTLALREIGEEDSEMEYWWLALRGCHYLRQRCKTA